MSEWQKVKVTFNDADGNEVSAVMWANSNYPTCVYLEANDSDVGIYVAWTLNDKRIKVTPIRELPTGVGAVIRIDSEWAAGGTSGLFVFDAEGWWHGDGDSYKATDVAEWKYEILSEGIQL